MQVILLEYYKSFSVKCIGVLWIHDGKFDGSYALKLGYFVSSVCSIATKVYFQFLHPVRFGVLF